MNGPVIRIYLAERGVLKVDAPISSEQDRAKVFELLAKKMKAIRQLDAS